MFLSLIQNGLSSAISSGGFNTTFSIVLAAFVHSGIMKREIKIHVAKLAESIDGVADALKKELVSQGSRIGNIEQGVVKLSSRVDALEHKGEKKK